MFSSRVCLWLYLIPNVLSIVCSIFVLYHFLFNRLIRQSINNHVIIVLILVGLVSELTDILWICHYYYFGYTLFSTSAFALTWTFIDYSFYTIQTLLFAWATIERHILVFYDRWLRTKTQRICLHYFPLMLIVIYGLTYYSIIFFGTSCKNHYDSSKMYGMSIDCIFSANSFIPKWGLIFNQIVPTLLIIIFSVTLLLRVLLQKRRLHQSVNWRKQRKMIIQVLSISLIYFVFNAPYKLIYLAYNLGLSRKVGVQFSSYAEFFVYYITFILPFVACGTLPELRKKLNKLFCYNQQQRLIHPAT